MTDDEAQKIKNEVTAACKSYLTGYVGALWENYTNGTDIDYEDLDFWSFPVLYIAGMEVGPLSGALELRAANREASTVGICGKDKFDGLIRRLYRGFYEQGLGKRLDLEWSEVTVISPNFAIIETKGTRYRQDGTPFNTWHSCYWLHRVGGKWKQFGVCEPDAPRPSVAEFAIWLGSVVAQ